MKKKDKARGVWFVLELHVEAPAHWDEDEVEQHVMEVLDTYAMDKLVDSTCASVVKRDR